VNWVVKIPTSENRTALFNFYSWNASPVKKIIPPEMPRRIIPPTTNNISNFAGIRFYFAMA
jgi:hypothetical protein